LAPGAPNVPEEEVRDFAFSIGKAIHHYGAIEFLINELVALLVKDNLLAGNLVQLGIVKRLELLESLIARKEQQLRDHGWQAGDLFNLSKAAFRERNKIAHNPFVVRVDRETSEVELGILVVRYHEEGVKEEWINRSRMDQLTAASNDLLSRFNCLLGLFVLLPNASLERTSEE
jgi:hypothetical protein